MPDINLPEVKLPKFELPEGLRDMTLEDIQKAMPDFKMPKFDLQKQAGRLADDAGKFAGDVGRNIDSALPRRPAPSPVPFAVLGMAGGLVVGWILATSPATAPRINSFMDWLRARIDDFRNRGLGDLDDELETGTDEFRSFGSDVSGVAQDTFAGAGATSAMHTESGTDALSDEATRTDDWAATPAGGRQDDFRGQSLGAASADDLPPTDDTVVPDAVIVDEVIVVAPSTGTDAGTGGGAGRMTDQMATDRTEGDDLPGSLTGEPAASSGRLTETMPTDDAASDQEIRQQDRF